MTRATTHATSSSICRVIVVLLSVFPMLALERTRPLSAQEPPPTLMLAPEPTQALQTPIGADSDFIAAASLTPRAYLAVLLRPPATDAPPNKNDALAYVNHFRSAAKLPAVKFDATLNENCRLHARYMAEENHLTHDERKSSPWYTPAGQACAQSGNAWLGGESSQPHWKISHTIESWMNSTGHRLWLLYPTAMTFGYGFYTAGNNRAGAALDVLSHMNSNMDSSYTGWPVRYPAAGQTDVPTQTYAITLMWRYFGAAPTVSSAIVTDGAGQAISFNVTTALPAGHKGIEVKLLQSLPQNAVIHVSVIGIYDGKPFNHAWSFKTGI